MTESAPKGFDRLIKQLEWEKEIIGIGWLVEDLYKLGIFSLSDLKGLDADELFARWKSVTARENPLAICFFRCAIYIADNPPERRDPNLTKWWNWA